MVSCEKLVPSSLACKSTVAAVLWLGDVQVMVELLM